MLHTQLIQQTGGSDGVRDYNLLDSALENPFQSFGAVSYTHLDVYKRQPMDFMEL